MFLPRDMNMNTEAPDGDDATTFDYPEGTIFCDSEDSPFCRLPDGVTGQQYLDQTLEAPDLAEGDRLMGLWEGLRSAPALLPEHIPVANKPAQAEFLLNLRQQRIPCPRSSFVRSHEFCFPLPVDVFNRSATSAKSGSAAKMVSKSDRARLACPRPS